MTTAEWVSIFDQIAAAGCLWLLITGGEPLVRDDFLDLYVHSRKLGMLPGVFTNATLVTQEHCDVFREYPPRYIEVSLYGATEATYERITGVPGSFDRCMRGIRLLRDNGCRLAMKTMLMTPNCHEIEDMRRIAEGFGARFRMDAGIFPRLNGDRYPMELRVEPEVAVAKEFSDDRILKNYREFFAKFGDSKPGGKLYQCGAGMNAFHVDAQGFLLPCLLSDDVRYDLRQGSFATGWKDVIPAIREIDLPEVGECGACDMRLLCGICPPLAKRETGEWNRACEYWCGLGRARLRRIRDTNEKQRKE